MKTPTDPRTWDGRIGMYKLGRRRAETDWKSKGGKPETVPGKLTGDSSITRYTFEDYRHVLSLTKTTTNIELEPLLGIIEADGVLDIDTPKGIEVTCWAKDLILLLKILPVVVPAKGKSSEWRNKRNELKAQGYLNVKVKPYSKDGKTGSGDVYVVVDPHSPPFHPRDEFIDTQVKIPKRKKEE